MENRYATLKKVYDLVNQRVHPAGYWCPISQVLVHQQVPWDLLLGHLHQLAQEELVTLKQADVLMVSITGRGIEKVSSLDMIHQL